MKNGNKHQSPTSSNQQQSQQPKEGQSIVVQVNNPPPDRWSGAIIVLVSLGAAAGILMGLIFITGYDPGTYFNKKRPDVITAADIAAKNIDDLLESIMRDSDQAASLYDEAKSKGTLKDPIKPDNPILKALSDREDKLRKALRIRLAIKMPLSNNDRMLAAMACDLIKEIRDPFPRDKEGKELCYQGMLTTFPKPPQ